MLSAGAAAIASGVDRGAVISLKVDYRTHSHAQGLIAVVYDSKNMGGILVCCKHGVITHSSTRADFWVPVDGYSVLTKKNEYAPLPSQLQAV